jgi:uroporphyrinogen decarboxylase
MEPIGRIIRGVRAAHPKAKVIVFARGASSLLAEYASVTGADGFGVDWGSDLSETVEQLPEGLISQGNLDPLALVAGGEALETGVARMMEVARNGRHIVNLGHGIVPQTPLAHVERLMELVRQPRA